MGQLFIVLAVFCTGLTPFFSMELGAQGWGPIPAAAARGLIGALILGLFYRERLLEYRRNRAVAVVMAISWACGCTFYIFAARHAPAGLNICIVYLGPLWIALYEWRTLRGHWRRILAAIVGFAGVLLLAQDFRSDQKTELIGVLAALVVSFTYAVFVISSRRGEQTGLSSDIASCWGMLLMGIVFSPSLIRATWNASVVVLALLFGIIGSAMYMWLYSMGARRLKTASDIGIYGYAEIPYVWAIAALGYGERISLLGAVGVVCVIASGLLNRERS